MDTFKLFSEYLLNLLVAYIEFVLDILLFDYPERLVRLGAIDKDVVFCSLVGSALAYTCAKGRGLGGLLVIVEDARFDDAMLLGGGSSYGIRARRRKVESDRDFDGAMLVVYMLKNIIAVFIAHGVLTGWNFLGWNVPMGNVRDSINVSFVYVSVFSPLWVISTRVYNSMQSVIVNPTFHSRGELVTSFSLAAGCVLVNLISGIYWLFLVAKGHALTIAMIRDPVVMTLGAFLSVAVPFSWYRRFRKRLADKHASDYLWQREAFEDAPFFEGSPFRLPVDSAVKGSDIPDQEKFVSENEEAAQHNASGDATSVSTVNNG